MVRKGTAGILTGVFLLVLLAGCAEDPTSDSGVQGASVEAPLEDSVEGLEPAADDPWQDTGRIPLIDAIVPWVPDDDPIAQVVDPIRYGPYYVVQSCAPYGEMRVWNLDLTERTGHGRIVDGTTSIETTVSWNVTDSLRESLVLAYQAPGEVVVEGPDLVNGVPATIEVLSEWDGLGAGWHFWLCLSREYHNLPYDDGYDPAPIIGSVTVRMDMLRDGDA